MRPRPTSIAGLLWLLARILTRKHPWRAGLLISAVAAPLTISVLAPTPNAPRAKTLGPFWLTRVAASPSGEYIVLWIDASGLWSVRLDSQGEPIRPPMWWFEDVHGADVATSSTGSAWSFHFHDGVELHTFDRSGDHQVERMSIQPSGRFGRSSPHIAQDGDGWAFAHLRWRGQRSSVELFRWPRGQRGRYLQVGSDQTQAMGSMGLASHQGNLALTWSDCDLAPGAHQPQGRAARTQLAHVDAQDQISMVNLVEARWSHEVGDTSVGWNGEGWGVISEFGGWLSFSRVDAQRVWQRPVGDGEAQEIVANEKGFGMVSLEGRGEVHLTILREDGTVRSPRVRLSQAPSERPDIDYENGVYAISWLEGRGYTRQVQLALVSKEGKLLVKRTLANVH